MIARQVGTEGVAVGELRGGDGFGWIWGPGLWWFPNAFEGLSGSARLRGRGWWHREGKGAPATANLAEGRRRPKLPEAEKTVVSEEFERGGALYGLPEDARARPGAIYSRGRSVPPLLGIRSPADHFCCGMATWRWPEQGRC